MHEYAIKRRQAVQFVICILLFAFFVRVIAGMLYYNTFDTDWYKHWAIGLQDGFFDCYARLSEGKYRLDYPPVYLLLLKAVGWLYQVLPVESYAMYDMLLIKFFPILFDTLTAGLLYLCCCKYSEWIGVLAAGLWALNPSLIFNSAYWGQTDGIMMFFLLLAFYIVEQDRPILGSIVYAVACLTKLQCLYFAPVLFLFLLRRDGLRKSLACIGAAMATGITAFIPFILGSWRLRGWQSLLTPFEVYFGGLGSYPYAALNTYNLYGIFNLNWIYDCRSLAFGTMDEKLGYAVGGLTLNHISLLFMLASLVLLGVVMLRSRGRARLWMGCFLFMQCVFMLTTRMHERYQIVVLLFATLIWSRLRDMRWLGIYTALSLVSMVNQFMLLVRNNTINLKPAPFNELIFPVQTFMSLLNLGIFLWCLFEVWRWAHNAPREEVENS